MSGVSVLQHFEVYQKARVSFVQAVADGATRPQNIEVMQNAGVMQLLRPLLLDNVKHHFFSYQCIYMVNTVTVDQVMYCPSTILSIAFVFFNLFRIFLFLLGFCALLLIHFVQ